MKTAIYTYSLDEESYHGLFDTREKAEAEANNERMHDGDEPGDEATIWTGEVQTADEMLSKYQRLASNFIENLNEFLADEIPSDEPILQIKAGHADALQNALLSAVAEHCDSYRYGVKNVQAHQIVAGE